MAQAGLSCGSIQIFQLPIFLLGYILMIPFLRIPFSNDKNVKDLSFFFFLPFFFSLGLDFPFESVDCPDVF